MLTACGSGESEPARQSSGSSSPSSNEQAEAGTATLPDILQGTWLEDYSGLDETGRTGAEFRFEGAILTISTDGKEQSGTYQITEVAPDGQSATLQVSEAFSNEIADDPEDLVLTLAVENRDRLRLYADNDFVEYPDLYTPLVRQ